MSLNLYLDNAKPRMTGNNLNLDYAQEGNLEVVVRPLYE